MCSAAHVLTRTCPLTPVRPESDVAARALASLAPALASLAPPLASLAPLLSSLAPALASLEPALASLAPAPVLVVEVNAYEHAGLAKHEARDPISSAAEEWQAESQSSRRVGDDLDHRTPDDADDERNVTRRRHVEYAISSHDPVDEMQPVVCRDVAQQPGAVCHGKERKCRCFRNDLERAHRKDDEECGRSAKIWDETDPARVQE